MAITVAQTVVDGHTSIDTSDDEITVAFGSTPTDNNLVVFFVAARMWDTIGNMSLPAGFDDVTVLSTDAAADNLRAVMLTKVASSETNAYVFERNVVLKAAIVGLELAGVDTSSPIRDTVAAAGVTNYISDFDDLTRSPGDLVAGFAAVAGSAFVDVWDQLFERAFFDATSTGGKRVRVSAAARDVVAGHVYGAAVSTSAPWAIVGASFRPAATGPDATVEAGAADTVTDAPGFSTVIDTRFFPRPGDVVADGAPGFPIPDSANVHAAVEAGAADVVVDGATVGAEAASQRPHVEVPAVVPVEKIPAVIVEQ